MVSKVTVLHSRCFSLVPSEWSDRVRSKFWKFPTALLSSTETYLDTARGVSSGLLIQSYWKIPKIFGNSRTLLILFHRKPSALWFVRSFLYLMYALLWGKMLGGLNPSTDLLVGSTSQYGPVLTEVPSQLKMKQPSSHDAPAVPLSDQEEETHTLMQEPTVPSAVSVGSGSIPNRIIDWVCNTRLLSLSLSLARARVL